MYPPVWVRPTNHRATRTVSCEVAQARIAAEWIEGPRAAELGTVAVVAIVTAAAIVTQRLIASTLRAAHGRDRRQPSGEHALERSTVCRCSVRRKHDLDRQREQRPQSCDDLLARNALRQRLLPDLEAATEVLERIAGDDRTPALDPEHKVVALPPGEGLNADRQPARE